MTDPRTPIGLPQVPAPVEEASLVRSRARGRILGVGAILAIGLVITGARGVQLAVQPDDRTLEIAAQKRWASVVTQGPRGEIRDADGHVLAKSVLHPAIFVDPVAVREQVDACIDRAERRGRPVEPCHGIVPELAADLSELLERPYEEVLDDLRGKGRYTRLARGVHPEVADRIRDLGHTRLGVIIEENYRRFYPQGVFASQLIGFVDDSGQGRQGLERHFHDELAGAEVVSEHRVNRWGRVLELWRRDERSMQGQTVHLTLDRVTQRATEAALAEVVERHKPISATAVVVEVATGRIVAMATAPSFDPNDIGDDFSVTRNLAVASAVEPGSVFKPFTMAAALEHDVADADDMLDTTSPWVLHGVRIRDDHPHPRMTVAEMVKYSSNIGAAKLAQKVGPERMLAMFEAFGLGERSGIDTQGEVSGSRRPRHHFGPVELATISYGQGATATTLQLAMATATVANDGVRMRPVLVDRITDAYGTVIRRWEPLEVRRVVSVDTAREVRRAMEMVMEEGGTGSNAHPRGYSAAGKTGTAEKPKNGSYSAARYASFVGFAPAEAPELAMAILVDEPTVGSRYGGVVAAPVFADVMSEALRDRGLPPDPERLDLPEPDPTDLAVWTPEPVRVAWRGEGWTMPDLTGRALRDALAGLQGTGVELEVRGSGALVAQHPAPGRPVAPGDVVRLEFR